MCVGPRSAVFAPLADIGLIVVDEEHESSYKHEGDPRYDARSVAVHRARQHGAVLVFGSATPAPGERASRCDGCGCPSGSTAARCRPCEVLDMRGSPPAAAPRDADGAGRPAPRTAARRSCCSTGAAGRTSSPAAAAGACGCAPTARSRWCCTATGAFVACHHCGHRERVPGSLRRLRVGVGRPPRRRDRAASSTSCARRSGGDGLPGLPPRRRLHGPERARPHPGAVSRTRPPACWSAPRWWPRATTSPTSRSASCSTPTRRCASRTSAPRSGPSRWSPSWRGAPGEGRAAAACWSRPWPPTPARSRYATRHDADGFIADELSRRRALAYPPFASLIRVVCSAEDEALAQQTAAALRARSSRRCRATVLGPAPLFRLRGRARSQLVVKASERAAGDRGRRARRRQARPGRGPAGAPASASTSTRSDRRSGPDPPGEDDVRRSKLRDRGRSRDRN